ncbi:MAG TPA: ABC transporter substrate-binding protein [Candidatus Nanoarchaeia archaeon]|nr:ABC transporter substrate-binding protein [Candidatus Nanoarchaeia archaeon]
MKKKLLIELAVLLILVVVVVGCRGGEVKTKRIDVKSSSSGVIKTINMQGHWKGEDLREAFVTETVKESEARNPDVKVNIKWNADFPGGREGALQATIDELKSGKTDWDIIWLEPFYYQEIAEGLSDPNWGKNYLVDFEAVPEFKESQKSFILSDPQFRNHMNGVITGPYIEGFYQPFFYNKDLTDKIGINIKESGMTFDDLLGYFKTIDDYNKAHGTNISILYDSGDYKGGIGYGPSTWNLFQSLFRSEFTSLEDIQDTKHSPQKLAAVKKVLTSLEQLSKYKPLIPGWEELPWFETRYYVLEDKAVFTVAGASWMYSHWHGIDARKTMKMVPVEMPMYQPVNHYIGGYNPMFAVVKDSPLREESVKLMMAFSTPNVAEKWVRYAKGPSGIKGSISQAGSTSNDVTQFDKFITYATDKYGGNIYDSKTVDYVLGEQYKDITLQFTKHLGDVMDGKVTADEAYNQILEDMKQVDNK